MEIRTEVKEAVVYRSGASIRRAGKVHLNEGDNKTVIAGLSQGAYTDTMQLRFPKEISASAVHVISREEDDKEVTAIAEKIDEITRRIEALKSQAEMWLNAGSLSSDHITMAEIEEYITRYPERVSAIDAEIRTLEKEKKKLNRQLSEAQQRDGRPLISVNLNAPIEGDYPFELVYQETAARWNSKYEVHTDAQNLPLEIRVKAEVYQNTYEDWKNIKIALRTGMPVYSASLPELNPIYLDFSVPRPVYGAMRPMMKMNAPMRDETVQMAFAEEDTAQLSRLDVNPSAEVSTSDTMTEYQLGGRYDIASGTDGLNVDLNAFTLKADYVIKAVPKEDTGAYLLAEVKTADLPMIIGGNAAIYLDGVYTGTARLSPDYGEETFAVALGTEERIRLSRTAKKKKSSEALIRNSQSTAYEYEITVNNSKDTPAKITVIDQIPVSRENAINVEATSLDKGVLDEKTGEVRWQIELQPQETKTLHVEYRVSWPKDKSLNTSAI